jgi:serpin B
MDALAVAGKIMITKIRLMALLALATGSYQVSAALSDGQAVAAADNAFAFKLLKQLAKEEPGMNIFISPYSATTVLQMVASGAAGKTKTEMQQVLETTGLSAGVVNNGNLGISQSLNSGNTNIILTTANAIWYDRKNPASPDFLALNEHFFRATVAPLNFADPHCVDIINTWASEKTHGRISRIADGLIDPVWNRLFLANAVYFKGKWSDPFDAEDTKDRPFHLAGGGQKTVRMMMQTGTFTYRHTAAYQAVRLPYEAENLGMYLFLPATDSGPKKLLGLMSGDVWQGVTKPGFSEKEGTVELPRFKLEYKVELNQPLQALGMKMAFDQTNANFSGIARYLYISTVLQKTFVEVKEEGTEAAAVTGISTPVSAAMPTPPPDAFTMILDRPFLFLIEDNRSGTILFMGMMYDPGKN